MSVEAITWALKQRIAVQNAKIVLFVLANYADDHGRCWPSQAKLAVQCDLSIDTVQRRLADLEALGLITRRRRPRLGGGRSSDIVMLQMPVEPEGEPLPFDPPLAIATMRNDQTKVKPQSAAFGANQPGVKPQPAGGKTALVRSSYESFTEPSEKKERAGAQARPLPPPGPKKWVNTDDPRWPELATRWIAERDGRHCPATSGLNGMGWSFPAEWVTPP